MKIQYKNTKLDFLSFTLRNLLTRKVSWLIVLCLALFITYTTYKNYELNITTIINCIIVFIVVIISFFIWTSILTVFVVVISHSAKKDKGGLTEHTLTFNNAGFIEETSVNRTELKWKGIYKIKKGRYHIYIYEAPNRAHIIPKRIFQDHYEFEACYEELNMLFKHATRSIKD